MNNRLSPHAAAMIPLVDLSGSYSSSQAARQLVASTIRTACCGTGFFYIKNHGVPRAVMDQQLNLARQFFALPVEQKQKVDASLSPCMRGYQRIGTQALDNGTAPDLKEGFLTGRGLTENHPYVLQKVPNAGPNQWPELPVGFRSDFENYVSWMIRLGTHLISCLALSLDLPEDYFAAGMVEPMCYSQLYHYPPVPPDNLPGQLGAGAHTDWGMVTILLQDDIGGLEVRDDSGRWIAAPWIPDTFVVNLGDMMPLLTNGLYRSNVHRVVHRSPERSRFSAPTFVDPDYFYRVECVPTCLPASGKPTHPPVTVGEHIANMYAKAYGKSV